MTLEEHDIIAGAIQRRNFGVVDARENPATLKWHFARPWMKGGSLCREGTPVSPHEFQRISAHLSRSTDVPLAVIVRLKDGRWTGFSEELAAQHGSQRVIQVVDCNGTLYANGTPLVNSSRLDLTRSTELRLTAANSRTLRNIDLPHAIGIAIADPKSDANLVRVEAVNRYENAETRLPEPVWLRLSGNAERGKLHIDIVPGAGADSWRIHVEPEGMSLVRVPQPARPQLLRRVALVLDRTCPDRERWGDALKLSQETHEAPGRFPAFNEGIRKAVRDTLASAEWPEGARCCVTWFADVAGQGISSLHGVSQPGAAWGTAGTFEPAAGTGELFDNLTYFPGLDVWDPLEEALAQTTGFFREGEGGAIFIVGNSPPTYPGPHGPMAVIAKTFGVETSCRYQSDGWNRVLSELANLRVAVYYIFLRLGDGAGGRMTEAALFEALQDRVEEALRESLPGRVVTANATEQGISDALGRALGEARAMQSWSGVELLDAESC